MSEHGRCGWSGGAWIPRCIGGAVGGRQQCTCPTRRAAEAAARDEALREEGRQQERAAVLVMLRVWAEDEHASAAGCPTDSVRAIRRHERRDVLREVGATIERGEHVAPKEGE